MTWDLLGFIYCLPCDSPRFLQMARHCGFFPGCNMNFVKRRRKGIGCCSMEFTPRWGDLHRHELPIRNGGFSWEYGSNVGKTMPQTTFFEWFIPSRKMLMTGGWCKWHCFPDFSPYQFHQSMWNQTDEDDAFRSKNFKLLSPNIWALNADRNAERNAMRKERGGACLHDVWV